MKPESLRLVTQSINIAIINPEDRYVESYEELADVVTRLRATGLKIVLTMGTFDMTHIGHARYLRAAREAGDLLVVGIDDDAKTSKRKGKFRPVVPEDERREMLVHLRYVDLIFIKRHDDKRWQMIDVVRPDVLIAVEGTYDSEELAEVGQLCGEVKVLPRQAETSTSAKVRRLIIGGGQTLIGRLNAIINKAQTDIQEVFDDFEETGGE
jgi:D-glycero-beta-D-manno-heptose 1-phosphate adenylyltransferase